ncbi:hypothetical protein GCM10018789_08850 [Streptomyces werraensis]|nr:hypothetical protein GCM10018789_08850 [Streptomyces werraensis]
MVMVRPVPDCAVAMGSLLDEVNLVCPAPAAFTPGRSAAGPRPVRPRTPQGPDVPGAGPRDASAPYAPSARDTV